MRQIVLSICWCLYLIEGNHSFHPKSKGVINLCGCVWIIRFIIVLWVVRIPTTLINHYCYLCSESWALRCWPVILTLNVRWIVMVYFFMQTSDLVHNVDVSIAVMYLPNSLLFSCGVNNWCKINIFTKPSPVSYTENWDRWINILNRYNDILVMIVGMLYSGEVERITIWVSYAQDSWLDSSHRNQCQRIPLRRWGRL